jgi:HEAT repeat protein
LGLGLGELEDPGAIETMTNALGDRDTVVRAMAAWALDRLEGIAAIAPLGKALSDDPSPVRRRAAWAAREIEYEAALAVRRTTIWVGEFEDASSVNVLAPLVKDSDAGVRLVAMCPSARSKPAARSRSSPRLCATALAT